MANQEALIIKDSAGTEADVTASNALKVDGSAVTQPVFITDGTDIADVIPLNVAPVATDNGILTQSVIHGLSSAGGGSYIDVKVSPSGAVQTALGDISGIDGQATMANSIPVVIASNQSTVNVQAQANSGVDIGDVTINNAAGASAVNIQDGGNSITIDGSVGITGTVPLPTNAAIETGGNLAAAATSLAIMDDWDETDRAKVNIIVGQAGVAAGAGSVSATTQRVTHASDDPVTTALQLIDNATWPVGASPLPTFGNAVLGSDGTFTRFLKTDAAGELQVDVLTLPSIPAGTNNIGDVDVLSVPAEGVVSSVNSSTATLGVGAAFTGTSEDITNYSSVTVNVISNVASATDGLSMQQSSDGTNWDILDVYTVPAATGKTFGIQCTAKFFRVVYTNGGTIQASFRLQTIFHKYEQRTSSVRPQDARSNDNDFTETIAYGSYYNGTSWDRMRGNTKYGLVVDPNNNQGTLFRGRAASFRTLGRAGTAGQKILAIHNATASAVTARVNQITVDMWCTVVKAITVAPPIVRIWKFTAVPTNGTNITKNKIGGTTTSNASVTLWNDSSADGTGSGTTLTVTLPAGTFIDQQVAPRIITAAGENSPTSMIFEYPQGIELAALEGICVFLDYTLATQNPVTDMWTAAIQWEEYTT